ncbi:MULTISPECIES: DMT family transporter [Halomonadaceae]|uniref:DMT family transporter n=1 Tax=Halomonadaceae TaxID=28256 RepID=UPI00159B2EE2|nr:MULTISPECIES: DMT family transporter [Halomonas]QJQ94182.1 DMT family transporter [Halomonas sp. PA5]
MATPSSLSAPLPGDRPLHGIAFMLAAGILFVMLDTGVKLLGQGYSPVQVVWARYAGHMVLLGGYLATLGLPRCRALMVTESLAGQVLRGLLLFAASTFAYLALRDLPLLQVYVVNFSAPLLVTLLAIPLLKERVSPARGMAVAIGFVGVIIAVGPIDWRAQPAALLPFGMALCFALYQLCTRRFGRADHPLTSLFYAGLAGALVSCAVVPWFWTPIALGDAPLFLAVGVLGAVSQLALIMAMRCAPASLVSPFLYLQIVWASAAGYLVFGDAPQLTTYLGAVLIIAAGIFLATRKHAP